MAKSSVCKQRMHTTRESSKYEIPNYAQTPSDEAMLEEYYHYYSFSTAGQKEGGQALLGGLDCKVQRNFFGAQINSFESQLPVPKQLESFKHGPEDYRAMFIRAPAIMEAGPSVEILSEYRQGHKDLLS